MHLADRPRRPRWVAELSLAALALAVTAPGFGNRFVQDELPLILRNERAHTLAEPSGFFTTPWWHAPFPAALYRPLATAALAVQWKVGGGSPVIYRWASAALLAGGAIALFHLGTLILPWVAALAAAALFAVHPVHVEAVALGINQGELAAGLLVCWATAWYIRARRRGRLGPRDVAGILLLYLAAALFKENALILPGLLLLAEFTVLKEPRGNLRPFYLGSGLAFALLIAARSMVLGGDTIGTFTAPAIVGAGPGGRALTMLGVVPHWARLLFWPANLQADYGPREIVAAAGWGWPQGIGLGLLVVAGVAFWAARRRAPALAFALGWIAVALIPVSNVLVPTGIALAERTLFLASAGAALAVGAVLGPALQPGGRSPVPALRGGAIAAVGVLLVLGIWRSRSRIQVWRDQRTLLHQTVTDAPRSIAAHLSLVRFLEDSGSVEDARRHYREAALLNPAQLAQDRARGDQFRAAGLCQPAVRLYRRILSIIPEDPLVRESLRSCTALADSVSLRPRR
ncbi:MAG TPA: hypothetical protein VJ817_00845 [Gemmatimonadales bacterium]|nr:hypothetical protein [Gemmatimonadales bacterium]